VTNGEVKKFLKIKNYLKNIRSYYVQKKRRMNIYTDFLSFLSCLGAAGLLNISYHHDGKSK
jgi:hypothetical protein